MSANLQASDQILILSGRNRALAGWVAIDEFEDLFARLSEARVMAPVARPGRSPRLQALRNWCFGEYYLPCEVGPRSDLLLVVARSPGDLRMIESVSNFRSMARIVAGYVVDSYFLEGYGSLTRAFDHVFCTTEEGAAFVRKRFGVPASVLRQGFDCLGWADMSANRSVDLIGFGRQPLSYHVEFQKAFHTISSSLTYLHSPIGSVRGAEVWRERPMLLKLLQRSKISLAFHMQVEPRENRPRSSSFVTSRWLESLATGCVVLGRRPEGEMADDMLDWPYSTIEIAESPPDAVDQVISLASDERLLSTIRQRNVTQMYRRHDWRYRIRDIHDSFGLTMSGGLRKELSQLEVLGESGESLSSESLKAGR